jgi:isoleucyl-tRNA synthetase
VKWLAPMLPFTTEEAWLDRNPQAQSLHLEQMPEVPAAWRNDVLAEKWKKVKQMRRVVTGALEIARAEKRIGSSLEAVPTVYLSDQQLEKDVAGVDMAEIAITSDLVFSYDSAPADAFRLDDVKGIAVVVGKAEDRGLTKCARSWRYTADVGSDLEFPDVSARDAAVLRELQALGRF